MSYQWASGGPFMGKIMGLITMYVMLLSNYYATTQHSHGVITNFHDLQIFLCPASHRLTRVPCRNASLRTFAADLRRGATSGGNGTSSSDWASAGDLIPAWPPAPSKPLSSYIDKIQICMNSDKGRSSMHEVGLHLGNLGGHPSCIPNRLQGCH
jgi:hypothetical protein